MTLIRTSRQFASCLALLLLAVGSHGTVLAQGRYTVSADGQEVQDTQAKLTWRRCAEGMRWDGKACTGKASKFSYGAAQQHASAQASASAQAWRLPTKAELLSLVDKSKKKPLIDTSAFPGTPNAMFWATRPEANDNLNAWIVNFGNGRVYGNTGSKAPHVRLVRASN